MQRKLLLLLLVPFGFALVSDSADGRGPNFVVINIDDLGYADIGPFGSEINRTPHLDQMAAEGRRLTSHYAAPVCSPSRASLMTGCYPKRVLPIPHVLFPGAAVGLNPNELTIADLLKEKGYATACIGKWHLGDQPEFLPTRQGFDQYFGLPYSNDMGPAEDGSKSNPGQPIPARKANTKLQFFDETGIKGMSQPPLPLLENERVVQRIGAEEQATLTKRYTEKAQEFIRKNQNRPFFLYLPHTAVHFPLYPSAEFSGKSKNGLLGAWVEEVDWSVGQVLGTIRELGLSDNTLVIFTSDNGGPLGHGASNKPLRGGKGQVFEGGVRVCTIAWWPGKIPAGTSTDQITSTMDILPTLVSLAGGTVPKERKIDGLDIWPVLSQVDGKSPRDSFHYYRGLSLEAVRLGHWKLHLSRGELYNLAEDIGETKNVASTHPEQVAKLRAFATEMESDLGTSGIGPGCRPLGRVDNPLPLIDQSGKIREGFAASP